MSQLAAGVAERGAESASPAQQDADRGSPQEPVPQWEGTHARPAADKRQPDASRQVSIGGGLLSGSAAFVGGVWGGCVPLYCTRAQSCARFSARACLRWIGRHSAHEIQLCGAIIGPCTLRALFTEIVGGNRAMDNGKCLIK